MTENQPTEKQPTSSNKDSSNNPFQPPPPKPPSSPKPPSGNFKELKDYYSNTARGPELFSKFFNVDLDENLPRAKNYLNSESTKNFLVDFGREDAWCAPNLEEDDLVSLLKAERPSCFETRWINVWGPELQKESLQAITNHYGLSARLQGMMLADPKTPPTPKPDQGSWSEKHDEDDDEDDDEDEENEERTSEDIELGRQKTITGGFEAAKDEIGTGKLGFSDIVNDIWHFSSIDYGQRYLCMGYNSIYSVPKVRFHSNASVPDSKRVWCWIILCDDATVISIQENPFPQFPANSRDIHTPEERTKTLEIIRRNAGIVFTGISNASRAVAKTSNSLVSMRVRQFTAKGKGSGTNPNECASLLFYAIFDDWLTIYNVVAKKEQPYGRALETLRRSMVERASLRLIDELHQLGKQLGVLKRIYKTYELAVNRLLQHQQRMVRDGARSNGSSADLQLLGSGADPDMMFLGDTPSDRTVGIRLTPSAIVRFERLADRIRLYALGEIEECLHEKETLTFLNFNLIALKDSQAVEKLTRITILLAKATILFLPVSLMTAYFSTEIPELQNAYTARTYWVCFAVISVLSIIVIWVFGVASGTVEGANIYNSLTRTFYDSSRKAFGKGKNRARRKKKVRKV